jgi:hypothetical protein
LSHPIDFILIYIREAHSSDGWKFPGEQFSFVANHRHVADRIDAVSTLLQVSQLDLPKANIDIYCDTMNDMTSSLFRAWPERLYVFSSDRIVYRGSAGPAGYSIPSLAYFLEHQLDVL